MFKFWIFWYGSPKTYPVLANGLSQIKIGILKFDSVKNAVISFYGLTWICLALELYDECLIYLDGLTHNKKFKEIK